MFSTSFATSQIVESNTVKPVLTDTSYLKDNLYIKDTLLSPKLAFHA